jgi:two-component sensor histidine kinase/integral membrane sensor domain MASE1
MSGVAVGSDEKSAWWTELAPGRFRLLLTLLAFSILYFIAALGGVATSLPPEGVVTIWPPNALVLVTLLMVDRKVWWAFFIATVATEVFADVPDYPLWAAVGYGVVNFSEGAFAAVLLSALRGGAQFTPAVGGFVRFLVAGPILASGLASLFGAGIYKIGAPELSYLHYWRVFWFGDALGLLLVGTTLLTFRQAPRWWNEAGVAHAIEAVALALGLSAACAWAFFHGDDVLRVYTVFPFLLWAAVRFGAHGASVAVLLTVGLAIASATDRVGPFASLATIDLVIALQSLSVVVALSTFFLAFTIEDFWQANARLQAEVLEHKATAMKLEQANDELEQSNADLDQIVAERTGSLRRTLARNEVLLTEVHHRVKNSLQMISAIVTLQGRRGTAQELSEKINKQVAAIAATYDVIHRMESVDTTDLWLVISELCDDIARSTGGLVSLDCAAEGQAVVTADTAVAAALAVNELVTNSIKHASHAGGARITVDCQAEPGRALIRINDNGPGFPPEFDIMKVKGFGLRMVQRVITGAGGALQLRRADGPSAVEVQLPIASPEPRNCA